MLYENDFTPEVGKMYIFTGLAHPDGTLTGGGTHGTIALEPQITADTLGSSAVVQTYIKVIAEQIEPPLEVPHYVAVADPGFAAVAQVQKNSAANAPLQKSGADNSFLQKRQEQLDEISKRMQEYGDIEYIAP